MNGKDIWIRGGIIERITEKATLDIEYQVIDGTDKYLMAGMADMHVHLPVPGKNAISTKQFLTMQLAAGITTVRSMRCSWNHIALKDSVRKGLILSPELYLSAPAIYSSLKLPPDSVDQLILGYKNAGFHFVKILSMPPSQNFYDSLLKTTRLNQIPLVGHVPWGDVHMAIQNKQRSIEHLQGYIQLKGDTLDESILKTKENDIYNCPTLD